jgi:hypothetical protein
MRGTGTPACLRIRAALLCSCCCTCSSALDCISPFSAPIRVDGAGLVIHHETASGQAWECISESNNDRSTTPRADESVTGKNAFMLSDLRRYSTRHRPMTEAATSSSSLHLAALDCTLHPSLCRCACCCMVGRRCNDQWQHTHHASHSRASSVVRVLPSPEEENTPVAALNPSVRVSG